MPLLSKNKGISQWHGYVFAFFETEPAQTHKLVSTFQEIGIPCLPNQY